MLFCEGDGEAAMGCVTLRWIRWGLFRALLALGPGVSPEPRYNFVVYFWLCCHVLFLCGCFLCYQCAQCGNKLHCASFEPSFEWEDSVVQSSLILAGLLAPLWDARVAAIVCSRRGGERRISSSVALPWYRVDVWEGLGFIIVFLYILASWLQATVTYWWWLS